MQQTLLNYDWCLPKYRHNNDPCSSEDETITSTHIALGDRAWELTVRRNSKLLDLYVVIAGTEDDINHPSGLHAFLPEPITHHIIILWWAGIAHVSHSSKQIGLLLLSIYISNLYKRIFIRETFLVYRDAYLQNWLNGFRISFTSSTYIMQWKQQRCWK